MSINYFSSAAGRCSIEGHGPRLGRGGPCIQRWKRSCPALGDLEQPTALHHANHWQCRNERTVLGFFPQSYGYSTSVDIIEVGKNCTRCFYPNFMSIEHPLRNKGSRRIVFFSQSYGYSTSFDIIETGKTVLDVFTHFFWPLNIFRETKEVEGLFFSPILWLFNIF